MFKIPMLVHEKKLEGIPQGYSLATGWSSYLADLLFQFPEKILLWPFYRRIPIDRPIFIVGPFRSGTTILETIISEHPSVGYFMYLSNIFYRAPLTGRLLTNLLGALGQLQNESVRPVHNPRIPTTRESPYECEWIWSQSRKSLWDEKCLDVTVDGTFSDRSFKRYLFSAIRRHLLSQRTTRFMNKNPINCLRLGYLRKLFPDARIVAIVRDPVDTIISHYRTAKRMERVFYEDPKTKFILQERLRMDMLSISIKTPDYARTVSLHREHPLLGIANQWKDLQQAVVDGIADKSWPASRILLLRYGDLVSSPARVLPLLWDFLELNGSNADEITRSYVNRLIASPRAVLTAEEESWLPRMRGIVAPLASRLGYTGYERAESVGD